MIRTRSGPGALEDSGPRGRRSILLLLTALLTSAGSAAAGQALAVLEDTSAFDQPSDSATPRPEKAKKGDLYVLLSTQGEWYRVQFDEKPAWLKKGKQPGQQQGGASGGAAGSTAQTNNLEVKANVALKRVIAAMLNVRSGPGMTGAILGTLPVGTLVAERGGTNEWRKLSFRGQTAYVFGQYLESEAGARPTASTEPQSTARPASSSSGGAPAGTAGALPGGGSSGLGTTGQQQGNAVQSSPFKDLLSMLTGSGGSSGPSSDPSSTPSASPAPSPEPPAPVTPGTPELPASESPSASSTPSPTSAPSPAPTPTPSSTSTSPSSMWDDAASTPVASSSTGLGAATGRSAAPSSSSTSEPGAPLKDAVRASDGVGYSREPAKPEEGAKKDPAKEREPRDRTKPESGGADDLDDEADDDDALPAAEDGGAEAEPDLLLTDEEVELVARIVQGEAVQCEHDARVAVAAVVLNRARSPRFPETVRRVVQQRLQFPSYAPDVRDALLAQPLDEACLEAAREAVAGYDPTDGATHFYNPHLGEQPAWVKKMDKTVRFGERPDDTLEFYRPRPTPPAVSLFDE